VARSALLGGEKPCFDFTRVCIYLWSTEETSGSLASSRLSSPRLIFQAPVHTLAASPSETAAQVEEGLVGGEQAKMREESREGVVRYGIGGSGN
jgi:hypothetical protein